MEVLTLVVACSLPLARQILTRGQFGMLLVLTFSEKEPNIRLIATLFWVQALCMALSGMIVRLIGMLLQLVVPLIVHMQVLVTTLFRPRLARIPFRLPRPEKIILPLVSIRLPAQLNRVRQLLLIALTKWLTILRARVLVGTLVATGTSRQLAIR